ncbi:hypothetical protein SESBI_37255 [Sesbania bispinosa]|nr:hypothetical protein SESBI_37255 [Sesbania bispinosa]
MADQDDKARRRSSVDAPRRRNAVVIGRGFGSTGDTTSELARQDDKETWWQVGAIEYGLGVLWFGRRSREVPAVVPRQKTEDYKVR